MIKVILPSGFNFDEPVVRLMDVHSRGVDRSWMQKRGAVLTNEIGRIRSEPGHSYLHLIALGAMESYGTNRNGDSFNKQACEFSLPEPKKGTSEIIKLASGLMGHYRTFLNGHCFKHHRNKDPERKIGDVKEAAFNPDMNRVELIIRVPHNQEWEGDLQKLANGKDIPFSMACGRAGTRIRTHEGFKAIEDVCEGDLVLTHANRWRRVTNTMSRETFSYVKIKLVSWGREILEFTDEHPFYAARFEDIPKQSHMDKSVSKVFKRAHKHELSKYLRWTPASELTDQHYLAVPIPRPEGADDLSPEQARTLGYYMGDGTLQAKQNGKYSCVLFTFNVANPGRKEIPFFVENGMGWTSCNESEHPDSALAVRLNCCGTDIAEWIWRECGQAETKHVPQLMFDASFETRLNFVCAWFNCDGWQDKNGLHWSTSRREHALDLQLLLAQLGVPSSCARIDHPEDRGVVKSVNVVEYVVNVSNEHSDVFAESSKASVWKMDQGSKIQTFISGSYLMVPIGEVERVEEPVRVYNFSVDEDESYTASLLASHNCKVAYDICSICGNRASNRGEYCDHLNNHMTEITKTGHQVTAINDVPDFFDISKVIRPADRIAWSLQKVASAQKFEAPVGGAQLAEMLGVSAPDAVLYRGGPATAQKVASARKLAAIEKLIEGVARGGDNAHVRELMSGCPHEQIPADDMEKLRGVQLGTALRGLASAQICLSVRDFLRLVAGNEPASGGADTVEDALPGMYNRLLQSGDLEECAADSAYDPADTAIPRQIKEVLGRLVGGHSLADEPLRGRVHVTIIKGTLPGLPKRASYGSVVVSPEIQKLAKEYAKYQLSFLEAVGTNPLFTGLTVARNYLRV